MSVIDIKVPVDLWDGDNEGSVVTWLYDDGATVSKGEVICEVMTEKVQMDIEAPAGGTLRIVSEADEVINKGDVIGRIE